MKRATLAWAALPVLMLLALLAWLLLRLPGSSLAGPLLALVPYTPEGEARRQGLECMPSQPGQDFHVYGTYRVRGGAFVLYSVKCPPMPGAGPPGLMVGVAHTKRVEGWAGMLFYEGRGGGAIGGELSPNEPVVHSVDGEQGFTLVYGRALKPKVASVEADFDNGQTVRDTADDGIFALASWGSSGACELRVLGENGQVLQRFHRSELGGDWLLQAGEQPPHSNCPE